MLHGAQMGGLSQIKDKRMGSKIVAESKGGDDIAELMGYDMWPFDVSIAFDRALGPVVIKYIKDRKKLIEDRNNGTFTFDTVIADFRNLEAEYVERLQGNAENMQQVRRIITERLLMVSEALDEPFETHQQLWSELQRLGFYRIERQCTNTLNFARVCREHGKTDLGLEVLDPVIAEVERLRAKPNLTKWATEYYDQEIESLQKLRARLEAERA
jgi:hypothetical protein